VISEPWYSTCLPDEMEPANPGAFTDPSNSRIVGHPDNIPLMRLEVTSFLVARGLRIPQDFAGFFRVILLIRIGISSRRATHNP
jgi:hypothetical protein